MYPRVLKRTPSPYRKMTHIGGVYPFAGLEYWTGLLDLTTGLTCLLFEYSFALYR